MPCPNHRRLAPEILLPYLLLLPLLVPAPAPAGPAPAPVPETAIERGRDALQSFKRDLMGTLREALKEGGPVGAIQVCSREAETIADRHATEGLEIGRTSHRLRNPANAPDAWLEPLLESYLENPERDEPTAVWVDENTAGLVAPLRVQPLCTTCHGASIDPEVRDVLRIRYPEDAAVGFETGDFRGLAWVKVPVDGP